MSVDPEEVAPCEDFYAIDSHSIGAIPDRSTEKADTAQIVTSLLFDSENDKASKIHLSLNTSDDESKKVALGYDAARLLVQTLEGYLDMIEEDNMDGSPDDRG